jgi:hypothetical protein
MSCGIFKKEIIIRESMEIIAMLDVLCILDSDIIKWQVDILVNTEGLKQHTDFTETQGMI